MSAKSEPQGAAKLLIDLGPLLVFFLVNFLAPVPAVLKIFVATGAFMVAIIAAMLFSAIRYGRISPLLWFSGVMVLVLGGLTIVLHKEWIIKVKPTVYYTILAGTLGFGLATGRPLLQQVLGSAYPGLDRGLAQADAQLGPLFRLSCGASTRRYGGTSRPTPGSPSNCGSSPRHLLSLPQPTSRCC